MSLETRAQAMEKDQLAQLLEEKDLLQKVQVEKIQNLTRMLVTSSSLASQQELKVRAAGRVQSAEPDPRGWDRRSGCSTDLRKACGDRRVFARARTGSAAVTQLWASRAGPGRSAFLGNPVS